MTDDLIPNDVRQFIVDKIDSVAELEGGMLARHFGVEDADFVPHAAADADGFFGDLKTRALVDALDDEQRRLGHRGPPGVRHSS